MANTNKILYSNTAGNVPSLVDGQIAIQQADGKIFYRSSAGVVAQLSASVSDPYDLGTYPLITVSAQPSSTSVSAGSTASFSVTASATLPSATISYQWQRSTDSGSTWTAVSGATASSLSLSNVQSGSTGYQYRCRLSANLSQVYTSAATLTVASAFTATAVLLTSGTSYTVPSGATSMKAWAVGSGGNRRVGGSAYGGGGGGCAYKTWSVDGGNSISYSIGTAPTTVNVNADRNNTTLTFGGTTITGGGGKGASASTGGTYSGGDGGANGGASGALIAGNSGSGGAVGGNGTVASCKRVAMTDVSGLLAAAALAGATTTEGCSAGSPAIGSGGFSAKYSTPYNAGYGGGGSRDTSNSGNGALAGNGCIVLYFT